MLEMAVQVGVGLAGHLRLAQRLQRTLAAVAVAAVIPITVQTAVPALSF
jgi:hypothetical protein